MLNYNVSRRICVQIHICKIDFVYTGKGENHDLCIVIINTL